MSVRTIAQIAGLSAATVSLALHGHPRISRATRERVLRIALKVGYKPNAKVAELMGQVRASSNQAKIESCLGVISFYDTLKPWDDSIHLSRIYAGMEQRAEERGYRLEPLWLRAPRMNTRRFTEILDARGIIGLLCFGSPNVAGEFPPGFDRCAIVTQGPSIKTSLHRVLYDSYSDVRFGLDRALQMGYRRPGMAIGEYDARRAADAPTSAYLGWCESVLRTPGAMPIFKFNRLEEASLLDWLHQYRPDVIILVLRFERVSEFTSILRRNGIRLPRDLGVLALSQVLDGTGLSGLEENQHLMGTWAVELLISRIKNNDLGIPRYPRVEMVKSHWVDGKSLQARRRNPEVSTNR